MLERITIEEEILQIILVEFNIRQNSEEWKKYNVFGKKIGMMPRDYINLIDIVEKKYTIRITGKDIEKYELKNINQLVGLVCEKLGVLNSMIK